MCLCKSDVGTLLHRNLTVLKENSEELKIDCMCVSSGEWQA